MPTENAHKADDLIDVVEGNRSVRGELEQVECNRHVSSCIIPQSLYSMYLCTQQDWSDLNRSEHHVCATFRYTPCSLPFTPLWSFLPFSSLTHTSGVRHHLQDSPHCTNLCPSQVEFWRSSWENVGISQPCQNVSNRRVYNTMPLSQIES